MRGLSGLIDGADDLAERLAAAGSEIVDVAETVAGFADSDCEDPTARIDRIEGRLDAIAKLKRKYGGSVAAILAFREKAARSWRRWTARTRRGSSWRKTAVLCGGRLTALPESCTESAPAPPERSWNR